VVSPVAIGVGLSTREGILMVGGSGIYGGYRLMIFWYILRGERVTMSRILTIDRESIQNIQFARQPHPHDVSKKSIEFIYCQIYTIFSRGAIISIFILITMLYLTDSPHSRKPQKLL
jgi:hypothetical protein